jgi:hypothetical protein
MLMIKGYRLHQHNELGNFAMAVICHTHRNWEERAERTI